MSLSQRPDLAACVVSSAGAFLSGFGVQSTSRVGAGFYEVVTMATFDNASIFAATPALGSTGLDLICRAERQGTDPFRRWFVFIDDRLGTPTDFSFSFQVERIIT